MNTKTLVKNGVFLAVFMGAALLPYQEVVAQGSQVLSTPDRRVSRELWDIWRQGFEYYEKGEMKMISGKYAESLPLYQKSLEAFQEVRRQNPQWNRNVIEYRMNLCRRRLSTAKRRADEASDAAKRALNRSSLPAAATVTPSIPSTSTATTSAASREMDRKLQEAIQENNLRKKQIEELQRELTQLRPGAARAEAALKQIRGLMEERTNLEKQLVSLKLQFERLQEEQKKSSPRTAQLQRQLTAEQNKSAAYAKAYRERSADHARQEKQIETLNAELIRQRAAYAELSRKYRTELQSTEKMVSSNSAKMNELSASLRESQAEITRLKNDLDRKNREHDQTVAEMQKLRAGRISADELSKKIEADAIVLREENRKFRAELENLRADRARLDTQVTGLNNEIAKLKKDLVINIEQRNDFAKANDSISKQFGELETSLNRIRTENAELRKKLDAALKERELLAAKVNDQLSESLKNQLAAARSEVERLTAERDAAAKEIARLKRFGDPAVLKASMATARSRQAEAERLRGEIEIRLAEESKKLAIAAAALAASKNEVAVLENKMKELQLESGRHAAEVKIRNQSIAQITAELKSKNDAYAKLAAETEQLRIRQQELTQQLRKAAAEEQNLRSRQAELTAKLAKADSDNTALRNQQTQMNARLAKTDSDNAALRIRQSQLEARLTRADSDNAALRNRQTEMESKLAKAGSDNAALQAQQAKLNAELAETRTAKSSGGQTPVSREPKQKDTDGKALAVIAELRRQLDSQSNQNRRLQQENAALKNEKAVQAREYSERNKILTDESASLRQQIARQNELNSALKSEQETLRQQIARQNEQNTALKSEQETLRQQIARQNEQNSTLKAEHQALNTRLVILQGQQKNQQTAAESEYKSKYDAQQKKYNELLSRSEETNRKLEELRRQNELINKQLSDSAARIVADSKQSEMARQRLSKAERDLAQSRDSLASQKAILQKYQQVIAANEKQRQELLDEIGKLQNNLRSTAAERDQLVKDLENVRKKLPTAEELRTAKAESAKARQDIARMEREKNALESNIARLQARLGDAQAKLESNQKTLAAYRGDVARLRNALLEFENTKTQLANARKESQDLRKERSTILKNAAVMEQNLKAELQKNARQILALRDENTRSKESIQDLTRKRASLEKDLAQSAAQIDTLKKQLAKALSEEEKVKLKKRIDEMTESMRKLASGSEDELVREAAAKNVVVSDLLKEQEGWKAEIRKLNKSAESYRILAMRQREKAEKAEEASRIAAYDARKTRGQLKMLQADIIDGNVKVPESQRLALVKRKYQPAKYSARPEPAAGKVSVTGAAPAAAAVSSQNRQASMKTPAPAAVSKVSVNKTPAPETAKNAVKEVKPVALPKEYFAAMKKGADAEKAGDLGMALWHYWQAADMADKQPEPYMALTKLHVKRKEFDSALKAYEKAILNGGKRDAELEKVINQ